MGYGQGSGRWAVVAGILAVLVGCGGGGSDGGASGPSVGVNLVPPSITLSYVAEGQSLNAPGVQVTASVSGLGAASPVFAVIIADKAVLNVSSITVTRRADGTFSAFVPFSTTLGAGTYTGQLTLRLCQDAACASPYSVTGGTLPYQLTITPGIKVTAAVNGVPATAPLKVRSGDVVSLQSSEAVGWTDSSGGVAVANLVTTTTTWSATLTYAQSTPGGTVTLDISATRQQAPQAQQHTRLSLTQ